MCAHIFEQPDDSDDQKPEKLPSLFLIAELIQNFSWTAGELKSVGLEERDFREKLARLRAILLAESWVLVE